jgi:hypothetical protein
MISEVMSCCTVADSVISSEVLSLRNVARSDGKIGLVDETPTGDIPDSACLALSEKSVHISMPESQSQVSVAGRVSSTNSEGLGCNTVTESETNSEVLKSSYYSTVSDE